ncbi:MAG: hypothetical protein H6825_06365 [Planctomycetes bacterium]|nr:hypothetical protein [Planctomycetota bacterium]
MKKLLVGCGCLVLVGLGGLGFLAYEVGPVLTASIDSTEAANARFAELDQRFPFRATTAEGLAVDRFEAVLDARVSLAAGLERFGERVETAAREGVLDVFTTLFDFAPLFEDIPDQLEQRGMGPTEFNAHVRLMWVALASLDSGVPGAEFDALRGRWSEMRGEYQQMQRRIEGLQRLEDLVGSFPPEVVEQARDAMARDSQRVLDGMAGTVSEVAYMSIPPMSEELALMLSVELMNRHAQQQAYEVR